MRLGPAEAGQTACALALHQCPQCFADQLAAFGQSADLLGLREQLLSRPLAQRYELDRARRRLYIDFSGLQINAPSVITAIDATARALLVPFGQRVDAVVNYDHFGIAPELLDEYSAMVRGLAAEFYGRVTRYGTTGFVKSRLAGSRELD